MSRCKAGTSKEGQSDGKAKSASASNGRKEIHFYRLNAGFDGGGQPRTVDVTARLQQIEALAFTAEGRYLEFEPGLLTCCWIDRERANQRIRVGTIRRSGLPQVERGGALSPLAIPATSGLVEQVHVGFFPNGIVGSEFNFYGPRMSRLAFYLSERAGLDNPVVSFDPLVRHDVLQQLERLVDIRFLRMKIRAPYAAVIAEADRDLGSAFDAARRATNADELEIILRMRPYSRESLSQRVAGAVRRLAGRNDARTEMSQFVVKGLNRDSGAVDVVDVLNDQLISKKQIVRESARGRALNTLRVYAAIEEAYAELQEELEEAVAIGQ